MTFDNLFFVSICLVALALIGVIFSFFALKAANNANSKVSIIANELQKQFLIFESTLKHNFQNITDNINAAKSETREGFSHSNNSFGIKLEAFAQGQALHLSSLKTENTDNNQKLIQTQKMVFDSFALNQSNALVKIDETLKSMVELNDKRYETIRETLVEQLGQLRKENEDKLEKMRQTVDEKLQGTLEQRLGESFKLVSNRLELVHKGLGEMQNLASGVGDLKKVLTNVKSRGTWGEVQLEMLLADMLVPEQYEKNAKVNPNTNSIVEFAIKLPGKSEYNEPIYLPIDAKFPHEDYERLVNAQDKGTPEDIEKAEAALEKAIRIQAKTIKDKYICPPNTTDFAIMYLPTEGLFAEVVRKAGFTQSLQSEYRIMVAGPTTLAANLSALQMGFRTLAIEKRSSEVWQILGAAKAEFGEYGKVWDKLKKQLETAQNTVEQAGKRTRAIERKLRDVEIDQITTKQDDLITLPYDEEN
jgi:DNA recombination protein RmuC